MEKKLKVTIRNGNLAEFLVSKKFRNFFGNTGINKIVKNAEEVTIEISEVKTDITFFEFLRGLALNFESFSLILEPCEKVETEAALQTKEAPDAEKVVSSESISEKETADEVHEEKNPKTIKENLDELLEKSSSYEDFVERISLWLGVTKKYKKFFKDLCLLPVSGREKSYKKQLIEAFDKNNAEHRQNWFAVVSKLIKEHGGEFIDFIKIVRSYSKHFDVTTGEDENAGENLEVSDIQPLDTESTEMHQWKYGIDRLLATIKDVDVKSDDFVTDVSKKAAEILIETVKEKGFVTVKEEDLETQKEQVTKILHYTIASTEDTFDVKMAIKNGLGVKEDDEEILMEISQVINKFIQKSTNTTEYFRLNEFLDEFKRAVDTMTTK